MVAGDEKIGTRSSSTSVNPGASDWPRMRSRSSWGLLFRRGRGRCTGGVFVDHLPQVVAQVIGEDDQVEYLLVVQPVRVLDKPAEPVVEVHQALGAGGPARLHEQTPEQVDPSRHMRISDMRQPKGLPLPLEVDRVRCHGRTASHRHVVQDPFGHRRRRHRDDDSVAGGLGPADHQGHRVTRPRGRVEDDPALQRGAEPGCRSSPVGRPPPRLPPEGSSPVPTPGRRRPSPAGQCRAAPTRRWPSGPRRAERHPPWWIVPRPPSRVSSSVSASPGVRSLMTPCRGRP
jgi:hypothetical protein